MSLLLAIILQGFLLVCSSINSDAYSLPETGQTKCYQTMSPYAEIPCAGTGQDGEYNINPISYTDYGNRQQHRAYMAEVQRGTEQ